MGFQIEKLEVPALAVREEEGGEVEEVLVLTVREEEGGGGRDTATGGRSGGRSWPGGTGPMAGTVWGQR